MVIGSLLGLLLGGRTNRNTRAYPQLDPIESTAILFWGGKHIPITLRVVQNYIRFLLETIILLTVK